MSNKAEQALFFPESMLLVIQDEATRQDRSLSWCAQKAWKLSRQVVAKFPSAPEGSDEPPTSPEMESAVSQLRKRYPATADRRKQTLYFPEEMLIEITEEAARLDRSASWVVQIAWCLAE